MLVARQSLLVMPRLRAMDICGYFQDDQTPQRGFSTALFQRWFLFPHSFVRLFSVFGSQFSVSVSVRILTPDS
jgi:hypothetical protein